MPFPPFEHARFLATGWAHGAPKHNLGASAFVPDDPLDGLPRQIEVGDVANFDLHAQTAFRDEVAAHVGVEPDHIRVTAGTTGANLAVIASTLDGKKKVVSERPFYAPLPNTAQGFGKTIVHVDHGEDGLDPGDVTRAIDADTCLVTLTSPNNPTGRALGRNALVEIAEAAHEHDAMVLVDQIYRELTDHVVAGTLHPNLITTAGMNKCWGAPGLRVGWMVGDPAFIEATGDLHRTLVLGASAAGTRLASAMFDQAQHRRALMEERLAVNHAIYEKWALQHDLDPTHGALTAFTRIRCDDTWALATRLLKEGLLTIPGEAFGRPGHVRIGLGVKTDGFQEALDALAAAW